MVRQPNDLLVQGDPRVSLLCISTAWATWGLAVFAVAIVVITINIRPPGPPGVPSDDAEPT